MSGTDTRRRLQDEALRLFEDRGFDEVTVEEIAGVAGVSHMTFFRHFPTKESVVLDDPYDPVLAERVAQQPDDLPALLRVTAAIVEAWQSLPEPGDDDTRQRIRLASRHPGLRARVWQNNQRTEDVIAESLMAGGSQPLESRVAAGAAMGALTTALFYWADHEDLELGDLIVAAMRQLEGDRDT